MNFYFAVVLFLHAFLNVNCTSIVKTKGYTPLKINKVACTAEKLKSNGGRYTCDQLGEVHCSEGWKDENPVDDTNRCAEPICKEECVHGMCTSPNYCACEVGWDGTCCDICIPMPGCVNGKCRKESVNGEDVEIAQTCDCDKWADTLTTDLAGEPKYTGAKCDMPNCIPACENGGMCVIGGDTTEGASDNVGSCACPSGFKHPANDGAYKCSDCLKASGCSANGHCCHVDPTDLTTAKVPGTCCCDKGWTGPLCDQLECLDSAQKAIDCGAHGVCTANILEDPNGAAGDTINGCACEVGWQGENCERCVPYWNCPNQITEATHTDFAVEGYACKDIPNQCWCKNSAISDPNGLCGNTAINGAGATDPNAVLG